MTRAARRLRGYASSRRPKARSSLLAALAAIVLLVLAYPIGVTHAQTTGTGAEPQPDPHRLLFWSPSEQRFGYRNMERMFPTRTVERGSKSVPLVRSEAEPPVSFEFQGRGIDIETFMRDTDVAGLLVVSRGRVVLERYGLGLTSNDRWTSFSVAKSITSTLVGAAIQDGAIGSVDDPVTRYLPDLAGSAYETVTIRHLLTMTSGVRWSEDYRDPHSDVNQLAFVTGQPGDPVVGYMAKLPREAPPGTHFVYKTGESDLIGLLVARATRRHLADYLSETIWSRAGMGRDAAWVVDAKGNELGGCCLSMTLEDYGRFGLFFLHGGVVAGVNVLPPGWVQEATIPAVRSDAAGLSYGFQWWAAPDGTYQAIGVFGQAMYFDPKDDLLAVVLSAWPSASDRERSAERQAFFNAIKSAAAAR